VLLGPAALPKGQRKSRHACHSDRCGGRTNSLKQPRPVGPTCCGDFIELDPTKSRKAWPKVRNSRRMVNAGVEPESSLPLDGNTSSLRYRWRSPHRVLKGKYVNGTAVGRRNASASGVIACTSAESVW